MDYQTWRPHNVAVEPENNFCVLEYGNSSIQKCDSEEVFFSKWGTHGCGDGQFNCPWSVAVASNSSVYILDEHIQKYRSEGELVCEWSTNCTGEWELIKPADVAVASNGKVYVADSENNRIPKFSPWQ